MSLLSLVLVAAALPIRPASPGEDARSLLWQVIDHQEANQKRQREYVFLETVKTEELRKDGSPRRTESQTFEVSPAPGGEYRRLVAENGEPLSPERAKKEEEKLRQFIEKQLRTSTKERLAAEEKLSGRVGRFQARLRQAMEVYDFTPLADEDHQGRPLRVFAFVPRSDYEPSSRATKILHKLEGTIWIDPAEAQIVKLHLRFREDLTFLLGIFGRISKGTEAYAEQRRVEGRIWLLDHVDVRLIGRLYFLKRYRRHIRYSYRDYQRTTVKTEEHLLLPTPSRFP